LTLLLLESDGQGTQLFTVDTHGKAHHPVFRCVHNPSTLYWIDTRYAIVVGLSQKLTARERSLARALHHQTCDQRSDYTTNQASYDLARQCLNGYRPHPGKNRYRLTGTPAVGSSTPNCTTGRYALSAADQPPRLPPCTLLSPSTLTSQNASKARLPPQSSLKTR
jgi:hypothetical protein